MRLHGMRDSELYGMPQAETQPEALPQESEGHSMKPKRIQRKRTKGWKMPPNTVYVGRPTIWGNPYRVGQAVGPNAPRMTAAEAVTKYREWLEACNKFSTISIEFVRKELRGKNLACWCPLGQPCHADVLLEISNAN